MDPEHCCNSLVLYSYLRHVQSSQKLQCADLNISEGASPVVVEITAAKCGLVALPAGCMKAQASSNLLFGHRWTKNNIYLYAKNNFFTSPLLLTAVIGRVGDPHSFSPEKCKGFRRKKTFAGKSAIGWGILTV